MSFTYNPNLERVQQIGANPNAAYSNVANAGNQLQQFFSGLQSQANLEDEAKARVLADTVANQRATEAATTQNLRNIGAKELERDFLTKTNEITNSNLTKAAKIKAIAELEKEKRTNAQRLKELDINSDNAIKLQNVSNAGSQDLAKLNAELTAPKDDGTRKMGLKELIADRGTSRMVEAEQAKVDEDTGWYNPISGMDEKSAMDLNSAIQQSFKTPGNYERYLQDKEGYAKTIRQEMGENDWTFKFRNMLPFGDSAFQRTWTPDVIKGQ